MSVLGVRLLSMRLATRTWWADEFDGAMGEPPDSNVWTPQAGGSGNRQLQDYTTLTTSASLTGDSCLAITARKDSDGRITSAQLVTKDRLTFRYGRVEARIKVPAGPGVWSGRRCGRRDRCAIGCGDTNMGQYVDPPLTTVHMPFVEMGETAAQRLLALIVGQASPGTLVLPHELIVRDTVAAPY